MQKGRLKALLERASLEKSKALPQQGEGQSVLVGLVGLQLQRRGMDLLAGCWVEQQRHHVGGALGTWYREP